MVSLRDSFKFEVSSQEDSPSCPLTSNLKLHTPPREIVRNEPNCARPGRVTEEIVQNEAKLGGTGVCGQWQFSCGVVRPASEPCKTNPISVSGAEDRAGTPNLRGGEMCKTNPIWRGRRGNVQNEPNLLRRTRGGRTGVSGARYRVPGQEGPACRPLTSNRGRPGPALKTQVKAGSPRGGPLLQA
jgi:hypothetical protein